MNDPSGTVVVYQGSKFFWRTRNTIDVTIVNHVHSNTTEIICYEPTIDAEAARIYLDASILRVKIDQEVEDAVANYAKQHNIVSHNDKFVRDVINKAAADYILNRLFLVQFSKELKSFSIQFQFNFRDRDLEYGGDSIDRMILGAPAEVITAHQPQHHRIITSGEVEAAMRALEEEQRTFREAFTAVEALQTQTDVQLGVKERWRIPIVLAKVAQNRRLSGSDNLIWEAMARNLQAGDDITKVAGVALRVVTADPAAYSSAGASVENAITPRGALPTPLPTPLQSPTAASTRLFSPKVANTTQGRLFAGTVSSQMRANAIEETLAKPHKTMKKFFKRGAHKTNRTSATTSATAQKGKKTRAAKANAATATATATATAIADTLAAHTTDPAETADGAPEVKVMGFGDEDETTFVGQLATTLATIASSISGKFTSRQPTTRIHDRMRGDSASAQELDQGTDTAAASAFVSAHGSTKKPESASVSVTCRDMDMDDPAELHAHHHPSHTDKYNIKSSSAALIGANLLASMSAASASASTSSKQAYGVPSRLGNCPALLTHQQSLFRIGSGATGTTDRSDDRDGVHELETQQQESPQRKRRSYFGSFMANFSRADSSASLDLSSPVQQQSVLRKSPSKPTQYFAETLTRLLSWRHHDQIVPAA